MRSSDLKQCPQVHCNFKNEDGQIDGIMCGNSGDFCSSDQWCTYPSNEKQSYWANGSYQGFPDCYSAGKSIVQIKICL